MSQRQFFSVDELPPTISGDSGRALAGLGCRFEKHTASESKSFRKKNVSKCHRLLMWTQLQTQHTRKRTGTSRANIPSLEPCAAVSMGPRIDPPLDDSKHLGILARLPSLQHRKFYNGGMTDLGLSKNQSIACASLKPGVPWNLDSPPSQVFARSTSLLMPWTPLKTEIKIRYSVFGFKGPMTWEFTSEGIFRDSLEVAELQKSV